MSDPCPYVVRDANGHTRMRYASECAAQNKARQIGGTYKYEPRS